ncbi:MAG: succinate dehydrogenase iron-sulfur subunit [Thermogutta sp.]|uniref:succinate dehydrogenase iron-sulfur subunit n=1 Tax=Thermogutta sp. TaxID=1962930 RepID=UPI0019B1ADA3|nr:succinate dehydrogenase iron-sulfur subunit [Thermogutta sp.]MBC7351005.1 succinate dehydrogenase iron-sulfur subunit [Thermogutta sp.]
MPSVHTSSTPPREFLVEVKRQDAPGRPSYWERFRVPYESDMNVISVLQKIAELGVNADGKRVPPVAWECNCLEEVCGACTMVINGRVRQACTALVDKLLADRPAGIRLEPMTKFPVIRDLVVDRTRIFATLKKIKAWIPVDSYLDLGPPLRQSQEMQEIAYVLSKCMSCGCCMEACPQYLKIEVKRLPGESEDDYRRREAEITNRHFMGAAAIAQIDLFNSHPVGKMNSRDRLDALIAEGGIQVCGNAQNCVKVCPKEIPLTTSIARMGRAATIHMFRNWFER